MTLGLSGAAFGGIIAGAGAIGGALIGANATSNASQTAANSAANSNALQWNMYQQNQTNMQPYMQAGVGSANDLSAWNAPGGQGSQTFNYNDYANSPAMAFQMQQGQQALERSAASRGVAITPGTMNSEMAYNQGLGSQYYQQAFNNFQTTQQNRFNQLASVAGMGENAAAGVGNNGLQTANIMGNNNTNAAGASIASTMANANSQTGVLNNLANMYQMQNLYGNNGGNQSNGTVVSSEPYASWSGQSQGYDTNPGSNYQFGMTVLP